ncbi:hypothetical protein A7K92_27515 [Klebsiella pneumoniae]|nr:hypothetical protein A7K92_27515 [Klebsiella pneumoniae]
MRQQLLSGALHQVQQNLHVIQRHHRVQQGQLQAGNAVVLGYAGLLQARLTAGRQAPLAKAGYCASSS